MQLHISFAFRVVHIEPATEGKNCRLARTIPQNFRKSLDVWHVSIDSSSADEFTARCRLAERIPRRAELDPAASRPNLFRGGSDTRFLLSALDEAHTGAQLTDRVESVERDVDNVEDSRGSHHTEHIREQESIVENLEHTGNHQVQTDDELQRRDLLKADDAEGTARILAVCKSEPEDPSLQEDEEGVLDECNDATHRTHRRSHGGITEVEEVGEDQTIHGGDQPLREGRGVSGWLRSARLLAGCDEILGRSEPFLHDAHVEDLDPHDG